MSVIAGQGARSRQETGICRRNRHNLPDDRCRQGYGTYGIKRITHNAQETKQQHTDSAQSASEDYGSMHMAAYALYGGIVLFVMLQINTWRCTDGAASGLFCRIYGCPQKGVQPVCELC